MCTRARPVTSLLKVCLLVRALTTPLVTACALTVCFVTGFSGCTMAAPSRTPDVIVSRANPVLQGRGLPSGGCAPKMGDGCAGASGHPRFDSPPMGWSSWNRFGGEVSQNLVRAIADAMETSGMRDAGYQYINIDDGWMKGRDVHGNIQADPQKFPDGMRALADYVHAKGLKLGLYLANYTVTCIGRGGGGVDYAGSLGYESQDVRTITSWGVDLLKYDDCDGTFSSFGSVRAALESYARETGKHVYFNIVYVTRLDQFGHTPDSWEAADIGDSARIASDVRADWNSIRHNIDIARTIAPAYIVPGFTADMDSLEIGNGSLTPAEAQTHMSVWAMMSAPLIAGNDLTLANGVPELLMNREVIEIDQDPLHFGASEIALKPGPQGDTHVLAKPLSRSGKRAVALLNEGNSPAQITISFADLGLADAPVFVRDVWTRKSLGRFSSSYSAIVAPRATMLLVVEGREPELSGTVRLSSLHWAYAAFNRIDTSPYASNIAVNAAPAPTRATVNSPSISTDIVTAAELLSPPPSRTMRIAGTHYAEGFGILGAPTQIAYRLDQKCSTFAADIGVDDSGAVPGAVSFEVWGDGRRLFDSGTMHRGMQAQSIALDVSQVSMLRLIVLGRTGGQIEDQSGRSGGQSAFDTADWAAPRLQCR